MPTGNANSSNLNLLRAIAVASVFVSHTIQYLTRKQSLSLGHAGVLLFFVHTSLVLMYSLERQGDQRLWSRFMIRRVFRIFPLSIVAVLVYVGFWIPSITSYHTTVFNRLSVAALFSNLTLTQNLFSFDSVPAALWSLPFEIQMYLVLPFVFLVMRKANKIDALSIWFISVALSAVTMGIAPKPAAAFFQFVPCFMAGTYVYARRHQPRNLPCWTLPITIVAFLAIYSTSGRGFVAVQWPLSIGLAYVLTSAQEIPTGAISRAAEWIAKYSYGIYLFHMAVLVFFLPRFGYLGILPAAIAVCIVSRVLYRYVEHPCIRLGTAVSSRLPWIHSSPLPVKTSELQG